MAGTDIYQAELDHKWTGDATIHPFKICGGAANHYSDIQRCRDGRHGDRPIADWSPILWVKSCTINVLANIHTFHAMIPQMLLLNDCA